VKNRIWLLLLAGFIVRLFAFGQNFHFGNDVMTFQLWAIHLFENGFAGFYHPDFFSDYPPVYMYVLFALGALRGAVHHIFDGVYWQVMESAAFRFFTFLPAILADLVIGFIIYKCVCVRRTAITGDTSTSEGILSKPGALPLFAAAAWIFNPAVILISASWGQVESVFVLMLLASLLFLHDKKLLPAYILFGLAILTKPQSLFLGPVFLYSAFDFLCARRIPGTHLQAHAFSRSQGAQRRTADTEDTSSGVRILSKPGSVYRRPFLYLVASILAGAGVMVLVSLPFGLVATAQSLAYGMGMYAWASVNAANFWTMIGANWGALYTPFFGLAYGTWGIFIVLAIIFGALAALHIDRTRHGGRHFFLIVAVLFAVIFTFSVRMHERYLFPALLFFLMYWIENRHRREFSFYVAFSAVFFLNCLEVLRWANSGFDWAVLDASSLRAVSFVTVLLGIALVFTLVRTLLGRYDEVQTAEEPPLPVEPPPMRKHDIIHLIILTAVYSIIAFTNLGNTESPQTAWTAEDRVVIDLGVLTRTSQFQFMMGARHDGAFALFSSVCGDYWDYVHSQNGADVFAWHFVTIDEYARFFEIMGGNGVRLQEIGFRGMDGEVLAIADISPDGRHLTDEQHLLPTSRNFMNSTYFDEIYHPRTGYEFVHGLPVYENTHPPLGKVFMAASIRAFGMTPFAWRLPGTLFGILMLPLIYAFARKLLKSNNFALFTAFIFAFDFMLFSHSRLATIDTFVTFFVLAMYYFMYCYTTGIGRNSLGKSLSLLALCGAAMGLAIAAKWQGVYGALGLPILFFPALYKLYLQDRRGAKITFFACFGFFIAVPIFLYILAYIPFVRAEGLPGQSFLATVWENQVLMFRYHSIYVLGATHPFASPWWSWPLIITPLWQYQTIVSDTVRAGMSSMGNPAVWWMGIVATGVACARLCAVRTPNTEDTSSGEHVLSKSDTAGYGATFLLVAYAANFLPWVFITRLTFIYHYFPSVPFVVLLIAMFFKRYTKRNYLPLAYAAVVFALFALFYPVLAGRPTDVDFVRQFLSWFPDWFLV